MPREPLEYFTPLVGNRGALPIPLGPVTLRQKVGRVFAFLSVLLPPIGFGSMVAAMAMWGDDVWNTARWFYALALVASFTCGLVALGGVYWWGTRYILIPSMIGVGISTLILAMGRYGPH